MAGRVDLYISMLLTFSFFFDSVYDTLLPNFSTKFLSEITYLSSAPRSLNSEIQFLGMRFKIKLVRYQEVVSICHSLC